MGFARFGVFIASMAACSFSGPPGANSDSASPDGSTGAIDGGELADANEIDAALVCPPNYIENPFGSCYRIETNTPRNWQGAEADCESEGAHLVVVDTQAEDAALPLLHWIGYNETITEGTFLWVTGAGRSSYENWARGGEPDSLADAYCTVTRADDWHDDNCFETKPYVCEFDGIPADPATWNNNGATN